MFYLNDIFYILFSIMLVEAMLLLFNFKYETVSSLKFKLCFIIFI